MTAAGARATHLAARMEIVNLTPWHELAFERRTPRDEPMLVVVLQGTFTIQRGRPLRPLADQPGIALGGEHRGDARTTSLRREGALATFKPRSDIHLDAVARAPGGKPSAEWPVRVRVGKVTKDLLVRGPHRWDHRLGRWWRSAPAPCVEVPLTYERAFGGRFVIDGKIVAEDRNPFGTGFLPDGAPTDRSIDAPQIGAPGEPDHRPGQRYAPQGVGPLSPHVEPRISRAGTFDAAWRKDRWPCLPDDFDYAFYNSAHPDLVYPGYLWGDEAIELVHLDATGVLAFSLPDIQNRIVFRHRGERPFLTRPELDTIHLDLASADPADHRAHLTWRVCVPRLPSLFRVDVRMDKGNLDG